MAQERKRIKHKATFEERLAEEAVARPAQRVALFLELIHAGRRAERERHGLP